MNENLRALARRVGTDESGVVAVIVAVFLLVLLILGALVLDLGSLYDHDRELQSAADAAALAGVQDLAGAFDPATAGDFTQADTKAHEYVSLNADSSSVNELNIAPWAAQCVYTEAEKSVTVDLRENHVSFSFAKVIGKDEGSVKAHAKAQIMYLVSMKSLFPTAIPYLHPHHFTAVYGPGETGKFEVDLVNPHYVDNSDWTGNPDDWQPPDPEDQGIYEKTETKSMALGPGLHSVDLIARNSLNQDLVTWSAAGSLWVPYSSYDPVLHPDVSLIKKVSVDRNVTVPMDDINAQVVESVTISVLPNLPLLDKSNKPVRTLSAELRLVGQHTNPNPAPLTLDSATGIYSGTVFGLSPNDFNPEGVCTAEIWITKQGDLKKKTNFELTKDLEVAYYSWFQRGQSVIYFDQNPDLGLNGTSTNYSAWGSTGEFGGIVQTKVFRIGEPVVIKTSDKAYSTFFGTDGWVDVIQGLNTSQEMQLALGLPLTLPSTTLILNPDLAKYGGNGDGNIDIGERVPVETGIRRGQWAELLKTYAVGKTIDVALVDPNPEAFKMDPLRINAFSGLLITAVDIQGNEVSIYGEWAEGYNTGEWVSQEPDTVYVQTAVLVE